MISARKRIVWALRIGAFAVGACGDSEFLCDTNAQCGSGMCQPSGYCSFTDESCDGDQRYGEHAPGELAGQCVPTTADPGSTGADGDSATSVSPPDTSSAADTGTTAAAGSESDAATSEVITTGESTTTSDSGSLDTGSSESTTGGASACDEQYSTLPDYALCMETDTACHVYTTHDVSCTDHCLAQGGECLEAFDNVMGEGCVVDVAITCDTTRGGHAICVCSNGCGGGPACEGVLICVDGTCFARG